MNMETKDLEKVINKWFDMKYQTYDRLEHDGSIYLYYEGQEYAEIRIDKKNKFIYYTWKLHDEFYEIISLNFIEFEGFMTKWVEDAFGLKELTSSPAGYCAGSRLTIPKINN